jgi:hypothetical protein
MGATSTSKYLRARSYNRRTSGARSKTSALKAGNRTASRLAENMVSFVMTS